MSNKPDILGGLDDLLAIMRDLGILERRQKAASYKFAAAVANTILLALEAAAKDGMGLEQACREAREGIAKVSEKMGADIEAIDKPPAQEG